MFRLLCCRPVLGTTLLKQLTVSMKLLAHDAKGRFQFPPEAEEEDKTWGLLGKWKTRLEQGKKLFPGETPTMQFSAAVARHSSKARSQMSGN